MFISTNGLEFLKTCEGCKLIAYYDIGGLPTIGYGTTRYPTGINVKIEDVISPENADNAFRYDLNKLANALARYIAVQLNQNQYDALLSFVYNVGLQAFKNSTLRQKINNSASQEEIKEQWLKWDKYHKDGKLHASKALRNRRVAELNLWSKV